MDSRARLKSIALLLALFCGMAASAAFAATDDPLEDTRLHAPGFLRGHPDLRHRKNGLDARDMGHMAEAFSQFQTAARYGDKPSQAVVAEMLWDGQGTERNRPLAYAWMDLAAERGYVGFLALRERYWAALSEPERVQAVALGPKVFEQYGDTVAKPRLARVIRQVRNSTTGSRTGMQMGMRMYAGPPGSEQMDDTYLRSERFWDPQSYQALMDRAWSKRRIGSARRDEVKALPDTLPHSRIMQGGTPFQINNAQRR